jgi:hypothetical protein
MRRRHRKSSNKEYSTDQLTRIKMGMIYLSDFGWWQHNSASS